MKTLSTFLHDFTALPRDLKLLLAALFTWGLGESLFLHLLALYMKELGATPVQIGNIYGLAAAAVAVIAIPSGFLADRWGRKPTLLLGWGVGLLGFVVMILADSLAWFAAGMTAYWLTAIVLPAMSSYIAAGRGSLTPERALTTVSAGFGLSSIFTPALGGWLASEFGFRTILMIGAAFYLVSTALIPFLRAQPRSTAARPGRLADVLANRSFVGFCALITGVWFVVYMPMPLAPNFLTEVRGLSLAQIGVLGTFNAVGFTVLNLALGRVLPRRAFLAALATAGVFMALLLQASWFGWIALAYIARPAAFVSRTLAEAQATRVVRRELWGLAFGALETVTTLATFLAPILAGRLYTLNPSRPFQVSLALLPFALLAAYLVVPRLSHAPEEAAEVESVPTSGEAPIEAAIHDA
jgi:MFS family permease